MKVILDCRKLQKQKSAFIYLKKSFNFPDYFGNNLDALYDCLCEAKDTEVFLVHKSNCNSELFENILAVITDASKQNTQLHII